MLKWLKKLLGLLGIEKIIITYFLKKATLNYNGVEYKLKRYDIPDLMKDSGEIIIKRIGWEWKSKPNSEITSKSMKIVKSSIQEPKFRLFYFLFFYANIK